MYQLTKSRHDWLNSATPDELRCHRTILQPGNEKLSRKILTFGLPTIETCPGASESCKTACYARRGHYCGRAAQQKRQENYVLANRPDFASLVIEELREVKQRIVRPHDSGDFFSAAYVRKWIRIAKVGASLGLTFYAYTRSWTVASIRPSLAEFANLPNVRLWYSSDAETGIPTLESKRLRTAYMQVSPVDIPSRKVDLVFRDYSLRQEKAKTIFGSLVCPYENGATRFPGSELTQFDCYRCGLCWDVTNRARDPRRHRKTISAEERRPRLSLAMV
jgi:hypothetical protein